MGGHSEVGQSFSLRTLDVGASLRLCMPAASRASLKEKEKKTHFLRIVRLEIGRIITIMIGFGILVATIIMAAK